VSGKDIARVRRRGLTERANLLQKRIDEFFALCNQQLAREAEIGGGREAAGVASDKEPPSSRSFGKRNRGGNSK
jgi:hypothetical protein